MSYKLFIGLVLMLVLCSFTNAYTEPSELIPNPGAWQQQQLAFIFNADDGDFILNSTGYLKLNVSNGTLDDIYLRLDTTNDPLTNNLSIRHGGLDVLVNSTNILGARHLDGKNNNSLGLGVIHVENDRFNETFIEALTIGSGLGPFLEYPKRADSAGIFMKISDKTNGTSFYVVTDNSNISMGHIPYGSENVDDAYFAFIISNNSVLRLQEDFYKEPIAFGDSSSLIRRSETRATAGQITYIDLASDVNGKLVMQKASHMDANNSASIIGMNSQINAPKNWTQLPDSVAFAIRKHQKNSSDTELIDEWLRNKTNCILYESYLQDTYGLVPEGFVFFCDTTGRKVPQSILGDVEVTRNLRVHEGATIYDSFNYITRRGADFNIFNGSLHVQQPITYETGLEIGDELILQSSMFEGSISPFINEDIAPDVWVAQSSSLCNAGQCAVFTAYTGAADVTMNTTVSTENFNSTYISFVYSLVNLVGGDNFRVEAYNGTDWSLIFTDTDTITTSTQNILLDSTYWNNTGVAVRFVCDASQPGRFCYVDDYALNGSSMIATTANVSGFDSEVCFNDGLRGADGNCTRGLFYSDKNDIVYTRGTWNITGTVVGGVTGSGTANNIMKWSGTTTATNSQLTDDGVTIKSILPFNATDALYAMTTFFTDTIQAISSLITFNNDIDLNNNNIKNVNNIYNKSQTYNNTQVYNTTEIDTLGNWSKDKSSYWNTSENITGDVNITGNVSVSTDACIEGGQCLSDISNKSVLYAENETDQEIRTLQLTDNGALKISVGDTGGINGWKDDGAIVRLTSISDSVGMGTTSPTHKLHVVGDENLTGTMYAHNYSGNSDIIFVNSSLNELMRITENGDVGIGTITPGTIISNSKLDVIDGHIAVSNNYGFFSFNNAGDGLGAGMDTSTDDELILYSNGTAQVTLDADGNMTITGEIHQDTRTACSFENSWVNNGGGFDNCTYQKDSMGYVHLTGLVKSGSSATADIFSLPAGYRPQGNKIFIQLSANNAQCRINIATDGDVYGSTAGSSACSTSWISLEGITFEAYQ